MTQLDLSDDRLRLLYLFVQDIRNQLNNVADRVLDGDGRAEARRFGYALLSQLDSSLLQWARQYIPEFTKVFDAEAIAALRSMGLEVAGEYDTAAADALVRNFVTTMGAASDSIRRLLDKFNRTTALETTFPELSRKVDRTARSIELSDEERRNRVRDLLKDEFREGPVQIIGVNGKAYNFQLDYYAGLVSQNIKAQAQSVATITRLVKEGYDLVRVSNNPSLGGDWCDAYRGRVYSLRGTSTIFPPLARLPNGGPPFHPWCRHYIVPFVPDVLGTKELNKIPVTEEQFLLRPGETSSNRIVRTWWSSRK